jgi:hypothetical protein
MKKNSLNTAVLASLAGIAGIANISSAVNINPDGTGQVLIYPYYTVNAGNQTLLSVVNTTNRGKAVKVRFLEGRNSQEVLDFNLYLSREDVWTAAILNLGAATAPGSILTFDTSCTAPQFRAAGTSTASGVPFVNFRNTLFAGDTPAAITGLDRTREGHFEMIEMASIISDSPLDRLITHVDDVPPGCPAAASLARTAAIDASLTTPSGGLFGGATVLNVANGTYINYSASALDGFWERTGSQHSAPDSLLPSLTSVGGVTGATSLVFSNGRIISSTWGALNIGDNTTPGQRVDAVSALFMSDSLLNEYTTESGLAAASEWVITFPTKRYYVNGLTATQAVIKPFTNKYAAGQACEALTFTSWNREELTQVNDCTTNPFSPGCGFSPPQADAPPSALCFETNILSFNQTITNNANQTSSPSKILCSGLTRNITTPTLTGTLATAAGWTRIGMATDVTTSNVRKTRPSTTGQQFIGLPSVGFWAVSVENNNATPGVKGFYGGAYAHRLGRSCEATVGAVVSSCFTP